jgi:hypothetical protein
MVSGSYTKSTAMPCPFQGIWKATNKKESFHMVMHILTADGLTFMNNATPFSVANDHPKFTKLVELIRKGVLGEDGVTYVPATGDDLQNTYEEERRAIQAAIHAADGQLSDSLTIQDGILRYKGTALDTYVAKKLIEMAREGFVTNNPLVPFIEKLMQNPSRRAVQDLYQFLEFGKNSLTEDGCFIAYKAVRQNWTDIHSGTFDNSIGQVVEVARNEVDEDVSAALRACRRPHHHGEGQSGGCGRNSPRLSQYEDARLPLRSHRGIQGLLRGQG